MKEGGDLLSRIALQYHRRGRAKLLCSEWEEVGPRRRNRPGFGCAGKRASLRARNRRVGDILTQGQGGTAERMGRETEGSGN